MSELIPDEIAMMINIIEDLMYLDKEHGTHYYTEARRLLNVKLSRLLNERMNAPPQDH
jgi:hypothetical protein